MWSSLWKWSNIKSSDGVPKFPCCGRNEDEGANIFQILYRTGTENTTGLELACHITIPLNSANPNKCCQKKIRDSVGSYWIEFTLEITKRKKPLLLAQTAEENQILKRITYPIVWYKRKKHPFKNLRDNTTRKSTKLYGVNRNERDKTGTSIRYNQWQHWLEVSLFLNEWSVQLFLIMRHLYREREREREREQCSNMHTDICNCRSCRQIRKSWLW